MLPFLISIIHNPHFVDKTTIVFKFLSVSTLLYRKHGMFAYFIQLKDETDWLPYAYYSIHNNVFTVKALFIY